MSLKAAELFNIDGHVALVTGGSSGVGRMIASVFAANGARTYITGRNSERLEAAAAKLGKLGTCIPIVANLSSMEGVEQLVADIRSRENRLDILVNNAGATWNAPIEDCPEAGWDRVFGVNVKAPFFLTQKLLPVLSARGQDDPWARVINISSVGARSAEASSPPYNSSKAAIEQLTRVLARGLGRHRITVNAIAPGWFPSRMNEPIRESGGDAWIAATPVGRFGTAEDMGGLAMFLCSRAGAYINGQIISTDGGRML